MSFSRHVVLFRALYSEINVLCKRNASNYVQFGNESVPKEEKQSKVDDVFTRVATKYDDMNDAMSLGVHRLWKDHFIQTMNPTRDTKLLDLAGGTGDIAFRFVNFVNNLSKTYAWNKADDLKPKTSSKINKATVCDINEAMLEEGRKRAKKNGIRDVDWVQGNAEELPFDASTFDVVSIAFGLRNCTDIPKVLDEAMRVLKPGGRFMCLEFSHVENALFRRLYDSYSYEVIPVLGVLIASDWHSYQYLVESIRHFPKQKELRTLFQNAGFAGANYENLFGGIAAIHSGYKIFK